MLVEVEVEDEEGGMMEEEDEVELVVMVEKVVFGLLRVGRMIKVILMYFLLMLMIIRYLLGKWF